MLLSYFPCNEVFDQPFLVGWPVSITFPKHKQQKDGVFLKTASKGNASRVCLCVSVWFSYETIKKKTKLSNCNLRFPAESEMC